MTGFAAGMNYSFWQALREQGVRIPAKWVLSR